MRNRHTPATITHGARTALAALALAPLMALAAPSAYAQPTLATDSHALEIPNGARQIYVMTDKPMYRPGETIWFRAWNVRVGDFKSAPRVKAMTFQLLDPKGGTVLEKKVQVANGVAANDMILSSDLAGGSYILRTRSDAGDTDERTIVVSTYELPRFKKKLEFPRSSYNPGERVFAELSLHKATGEPLHRARAQAVIWVDGNQVARRTVRADRQGLATIPFDLPARIAKGEGFVTVMVDHGGITESIQRRIPIATQSVELDLFPEGGNLVSGLPSRVYFSARDPFGEPVDIRGAVLDSAGTKVTEMRSDVRGMGRFEFTPAPGVEYHVSLASPKSVRGKVVRLPAIQESGCTLRSQDDFRSEKSELALALACTQGREVIVTGVLRESLVARVDALVTSDKSTEGPVVVRLPIPADRQGAVRVTVFDRETRAPLAERLVYRGLGRDIGVTIRADKESYSPRDQVTLDIHTTDARGKNVAAEVAIAVVDDTVLSLANDESAHILASLHLLPEMPGQRIDDPDFYFSDHQDAPRAMDLLLGTKGWRRFTWKWRPL